jgi:hypothetical protein
MMNRAQQDSFKPVAPQLPASMESPAKKKPEEVKTEFAAEEVYEAGVAEIKPRGYFSSLFS